MSNKKELSKKELESVSGGESVYGNHYCHHCRKTTDVNRVQVGMNGKTPVYKDFCSICGNPYMEVGSL